MPNDKEAMDYLKDAHDSLQKALEKVGQRLGVNAGIMIQLKPPEENLKKAFELYNDLWDVLGKMRRILSSN